MLVVLTLMTLSVRLASAQNAADPAQVSPAVPPAPVTVDPKTLQTVPPAKTVPEGGPPPVQLPPKPVPIPDPVIQLQEGGPGKPGKSPSCEHGH
jgi:hypothetical protein